MTPPAPGARLDPDSPLEQATASMMLASVKAAMDAKAWELFNLWFEGKAPPLVVIDTPAWADYMRADKRLAALIRNKLQNHAIGMRAEMDGPLPAGQLRRPLQLKFHGEVGSTAGGFVTGYEVLHGTNAAAGDFEITGRCLSERQGPAGSAYVMRYEGLRFAFNDIVDANKRWTADAALARTAANMAKVLKVGPPKDYQVRIQWSDPKPVEIRVDAVVAGQSPGWLKSFPNR